MFSEELKIGRHTFKVSIQEETIYDADVKVNGRFFYASDCDSEDECLGDLERQILEAFPELAESDADEENALTPVWMRKGIDPVKRLAEWNAMAIGGVV